MPSSAVRTGPTPDHPDSGSTPGRPSPGQRLLDAVERIGNRLPEPFTLFLSLFIITGIVSTVMALAGLQVTVPGSEEVVRIRGLFTGEGMAWLTANLGPNYIGFPPLVTVLPLLLAVGVAEKTGMLAALVRLTFGSAPRWALPYAVGFIGVSFSIMGDASFIVIPPLAALVFQAAGRHPVAGLLGGFAATGAGFSTSVFPTALDALFAGITTAVMDALPGFAYSAVNPISNYFFNAAAAIVLSIIAGFIIDRVLEPQLERTGTPRTQVDAAATRPATASGTEETGSAKLSAPERRGLAAAGLASLGLAALMLTAVLIPASPWRNAEGGFLPTSPLLDSIVFIIFTVFMTNGIVYGVVAGRIRAMNDIVTMMGRALTDMISFLVLAFVLGQFIALFNWSGIGSFTAVRGAEALEAAGLTGFTAVVGFIALASCLNLLIISGSSLWTLMAAVFVPMFALIGFEPAYTQAAFRVGDSATQVITPLNPYMLVLLGLLRRYQPEAGIGTLIARMLPFVIPFWLAWVGLLGLWYLLDWPMGPGNPILL